MVPVEKPVPAKASWLNGVKGRYATKRGRYRYALPAIVVVVALILARQGLKTMGHEVSKGLSAQADQHDQTIISAVERLAAPATQQVTVSNVLSWLPCPLTADAKGMIGYDPPGGPTLNAQRAAAVETQTHKWLIDHTPKELRISQPDATHLVVFVLPITDGVPLIDCTEQQLPASTPTTATR